ncbi:MAG: hypothetical protein U0872_15790 [Planctomycetaceae bacterium]
MLPLLLLLFGILVLANAGTVLLLKRRIAVMPWWLALFAAWLAGAAVGVWAGVFFEYQPEPHVRIIGFPVPEACFIWQGPPGEEQWVDYVSPVPLLLILSNILFWGLLAGCPVGLIYWMSHSRPR